MNEEQVFSLLVASNPIPRPDLLDPPLTTNFSDERSLAMYVQSAEKPMSIDGSRAHGLPRRSPTSLVAAAFALILGIGAWILVIDAEDPVANPEAVAVGNELVGAFAQHDSGTVLALLGPDPQIDVFGVATVEDFTALFSWMEMLDWQFHTEGCTAPLPERVTCVMTISNRWSEASGSGPGTSELRLVLAGDRIAEITHSLVSWPSFRSFYDFVASNHPDDVDRMWRTSLYGGVHGPILNDEALALFDRYTEEYETARGSG